MEFSEDLHRRLAAEGTVTLSLRVRPGATMTQVRGMMADGSVKIDLAATPEDGRANEELLKFLSRCTDVPVQRIEILSGQTSRRKLVRITG